MEVHSPWLDVVHLERMKFQKLLSVQEDNSRSEVAFPQNFIWMVADVMKFIILQLIRVFFTIVPFKLSFDVHLVYLLRSMYMVTPSLSNKIYYLSKNQVP